MNDFIIIDKFIPTERILINKSEISIVRAKYVGTNDKYIISFHMNNNEIIISDAYNNEECKKILNNIMGNKK